jgi:hypothetical protein
LVTLGGLIRAREFEEPRIGPRWRRVLTFQLLQLGPELRDKHSLLQMSLLHVFSDGRSTS